MDRNISSVNCLVDHLFRNEAGKLVSILTKLFGPANIDLAEDIVQDTLISALDHWTINEIPDNPAAWITQVAKRKALNELKRHKVAQKFLATEIKNDFEFSQIDEVFLTKEIHDSQLRMIFSCCHPELLLESQISLTLKVLCGFGVKEIAQALMTTEETINKRLYRAKEKFRSNEIPFEIPLGKDLDTRLRAVCLSLYLLFNEGYSSAYAQTMIRKDLCLEAIRLTFLLTQHFVGKAEVYALLSLMCFHAARFDARLDKDDAIIIFEDQDRKLWNRDLISKGFNYLQQASKGKIVSAYHLEAGIAAEHCLAKSFEETNWQSIYSQYELLYKLKKNPIVKLNLAIVYSQITNPERAIVKLEELIADKELDGYYLLPATLGIFYLKANNFLMAKLYLTKAKSLTNSKHEQTFLDKRLEECKV